MVEVLESVRAERILVRIEVGVSVRRIRERGEGWDLDILGRRRGVLGEGVWEGRRERTREVGTVEVEVVSVGRTEGERGVR